MLELEDCLADMGVPNKLARKFAHGIAQIRSDAVRIGIATPEREKEAARKAREQIRATVATIPRLSDEQRASFSQKCLHGKFRGIGLGSQVSQLVELAVLDDADHFIKERLNCRYYERYMDDFRIISDTKERLQECWAAVEQMVHALGLELNQKSCIYPLRYGVRFLHWKFILTDTGAVIRRIDPKKLTKERRCLRKLKEELDAGARTMTSIEDHYQSFCANLERGNTREDVRKMDIYYKALFGIAPIKPKKKGAKNHGHRRHSKRTNPKAATGKRAVTQREQQPDRDRRQP